MEDNILKVAPTPDEGMGLIDTMWAYIDGNGVSYDTARNALARLAQLVRAYAETRRRAQEARALLDLGDDNGTA